MHLRNTVIYYIQDKSKLTSFQVDVVLNVESFSIVRGIAVEPQQRLTALVDIEAVECICTTVCIRTILRVI